MNGSNDTEQPQPSQELYEAARAGFVLQGTTFAKWCRKNGVLHTNAMQALLGSWSGRAGKTLLKRIVIASRADELLELKGRASNG